MIVRSVAPAGDVGSYGTPPSRNPDPVAVWAGMSGRDTPPPAVSPVLTGLKGLAFGTMRDPESRSISAAATLRSKTTRLRSSWYGSLSPRAGRPVVQPGRPVSPPRAVPFGLGVRFPRHCGVGLYQSDLPGLSHVSRSASRWSKPVPVMMSVRSNASILAIAEAVGALGRLLPSQRFALFSNFATKQCSGPRPRPRPRRARASCRARPRVAGLEAAGFDWYDAIARLGKALCFVEYCGHPTRRSAANGLERVDVGGRRLRPGLVRLGCNRGA